MPGHATSTSCRLCRDIPVAQGPDKSYCTPLALCECGGQWFLMGGHRLILNLIDPRYLRMFGFTTSERCTSFDAKAGVMFRMNGLSRAQDAHDCRDAGGRATQEQLPRSDWFSFAQLLKLKARAYMDVFTASPGKLIPIAASPSVQIIRSKASEFLRRLVRARHLSR